MAEQVALEVTANSSQAENSVKSLKAQLREAQADVSKMADKFGETSAQAIEAAKRASQLKDRIGDAKALTESFNPDKKFQAFASALNGVVGGFSAVQGAMGLFGSESEDVQKTLLKVQSAMAMVQGLNAVTESIDAFKNLGAVIKATTVFQTASAVAQRIWNVAMAANPIGAIVVAVTALIAGLVSLVSWFKKSSDAAKEQANAVAETNKQLTNQKKLLEEHAAALDRSNKQQLAMAKASGMSAAKMRELEISLINKKVADAQASSVTALHTVELEKQALATLKSKGANEEVIKAQEENVKKAREILTTANENVVKAGNERIDIINRQQVDIAQAETDAHNKQLEKQKEAEKKRLEALKEYHKKVEEANKKAHEDLIKLEEENYLSTIKDDNEKAAAKLVIDYENRRKEINASIADANEKAKLLAALDTKFQNDKLAIDEKLKADQDAKDQAQFEQDIKDYELNQAMANAEIDDLMLQLQTEADLERKHADELKQIEEYKFQHKKQMAEAYIGVISNLQDAVGKDTAVGKALGIATATINTYIGATEVLRAKSVLPEPMGTIAKVINVAAIIASGVKAVKAITSVKVPGGGGGGGSMPSVSAPIAPQMSQTALNQQMINQVGNAATRAFVVESDVSGSQERIRRLNRAARIN